MPINDPELKKQYQREWLARRRAEWLTAHGPCTDCKSWSNLEVDHVDPSIKVTHNVWSWSKVRRDAELSKCVVRCHDCHRVRTIQQLTKPTVHGTRLAWSRGCRCRSCINANNDSKKQWRLKTGRN